MTIATVLLQSIKKNHAAVKLQSSFLDYKIPLPERVDREKLMLDLAYFFIDQADKRKEGGFKTYEISEMSFVMALENRLHWNLKDYIKK